MQNGQHKLRSRLDENVLLRRQEVKKLDKVNTLSEHARKEAQKIVAQSHRQAELIYRQAFTAGYEEGMLMAAEAVSEFISAVDKQSRELSKQLATEIQQKLTEFFSDEKIVLAVLDGWLDQTLPEKEGGVQLLLPDACKAFHRHALDLVASKTSGNIEVVYHKETHFIFKYRDRIASFEPQIIIDEQKETKIVFNRIYQEFSGISQAAFKALQEKFSALEVNIETDLHSADNQEQKDDDY